MIRADRLRADLMALANFGAIDKGVDRPCYSPAYRAAADWLKERMRDAGLSVREDAAGNVIGHMGPVDGPAVVCGSHIDSVPAGGIYDGTLGVLAGVEVARCLGDHQAVLRNAYEVIAFADEEGAYLSELGARAMIGDMTVGELDACHGRSNKRVADAMNEYGLDASKIGMAARPHQDFSHYVELHIEQGPVLERSGSDIGVVTGIVGLHVSELTFTGTANHAGTTPIPLRRDAFRAAAEAMTEAYAQLESRFSSAKHRLTYGMAKVAPGVHNVVPASATLTQEIRAESEEDIDALYAMTREVASSVAGRHGVELTATLVSRDAPASMTPKVMDLIERCANEAGYKFERLPSGAGHDAQIMARVCDTAMIFIPSQAGISHNPDEYSTDEQIRRGTDVLLRTVNALVSRGKG